MKKYFEVLKYISRNIGVETTVKDECWNFLNLLYNYFTIEKLVLFLIDPDKRYFRFVCGIGVKKKNVDEQMPVGRLPWEWMREKGLIDKIPEGSIASIPLFHLNEIQGLLCIGFKEEIDEPVLQFIEILTLQFAGIISYLGLMEKIDRDLGDKVRLLKESEDRFRILAENALVGVFMMVEGELVYTNPAFEKIFGYTYNELKKINFPFSLVDEKERYELMEVFSLPTPFESKFQFKCRRQTGENVYVKGWVRGIRFRNKRYLIGSVLDITSQKEAADELKKSEEKYRRLVESIPDIVFVLDTEGNVSWINTSAEKILGFSVDKIIGSNVEIFLQREEKEKFRKRFASLLSGDSSLNTRIYTLKDIHGRKKYLEVKSMPIIENGKVVAIQGIGRDVTEEISSRFALQEAHTRLEDTLSFQELLLETAPIGIAVVDRNLVCITWNKTAEKITGYTREEAVGMSILDLFYRKGDEERKEAEEWLMRAFKTGALEGEINAVMKNRKKRILHLHTVVIQRKEKEPMLLIIARDVTEEKKMQENMLQMQKMESISTFTAGIAHDFNNTLTAIQSNVELLYDEVTDKGKEILDTILISVKQSANMVKQLLSFTRQRVGMPEVLEVNEVVKETLSIVRRMVPEDVRIKTNLSRKPLHIFADRTQVQEILMNLTTNAVDAMPHGGTLTFSTSLVTYERDGKPRKCVRISVSDTGIGMDQKTIERIFDPFYTTKERGTGLGLSVVFGLVESNNGEIWVESRPGKGTTFYINFPLFRGKIPEKKEEVEEEYEGRETILYVEDEPFVRDSISTQLKRMGYKVISVESVNDAIQILTTRDDIDIVVSDIVLPDGNAMTIYRKVVEDFGKEIPFLFVSGYTDDLLLKKGVETGRYQFIQKPFSSKILARKIRNVLDGIDTHHR